MIKAVIFDLDGTLLPIDEDQFVKLYFGLLAKKLFPYGYNNSDELIETVWAGTKAMFKNNGAATNEEVFWNIFTEKFGKDSINHKSIFEDFYQNEFKEVKSVCKENPLAKQAIEIARQKKLKIILASNPVFPQCALLTRASFVNLNNSDFDYITSYDLCHFSKPNPKYFEEVLKNNNLLPSEAIMFGNSEKDDFIPATAVGIKTYLLNPEIGINFDEVIKILKDINL